MKRSLVVLAALGFASLADAQAPRARPTLGPTLVSAAVGVRDAGDFGTMWLASVGARRQVSRVYALTAALTYSWREPVACPAGVPSDCVEGSLSVTSLDAGAEYPFLGDLPIYAVAALGFARARGAIENWGATYTTGLGVRFVATPNLAVAVEGRWREDRFGSRAARGLSATIGTAYHW